MDPTHLASAAIELAWRHRRIPWRGDLPHAVEMQARGPEEVVAARDACLESFERTGDASAGVATRILGEVAGAPARAGGHWFEDAEIAKVWDDYRKRMHRYRARRGLVGYGFFDKPVVPCAFAMVLVAYPISGGILVRSAVPPRPWLSLPVLVAQAAILFFGLRAVSRSHPRAWEALLPRVGVAWVAAVAGAIAVGGGMPVRTALLSILAAWGVVVFAFRTGYLDSLTLTVLDRPDLAGVLRSHRRDMRRYMRRASRIERLRQNPWRQT